MTRFLQFGACAVVLLAATGCSGGSTGESRPSASPSTTTSSTIIDYTSRPDGRVVIAAPDDVLKLTGAPDDFKNFMAGQISALAHFGNQDDPDPCSKFARGIEAIDTSGFALGDDFVPECGGATFMWARRDGVWQEIYSGQMALDCETLQKYAVPRKFYAVVSKSISGGDGTCLTFPNGDDGTSKAVPYEG